MSIDAEILLAIGTVIAGIALLGGVWLTLRRPARAHGDTPGTRRTSTSANPIALALHRDTLEKRIGLSQPRAGSFKKRRRDASRIAIADWNGRSSIMSFFQPV